MGRAFTLKPFAAVALLGGLVELLPTLLVLQAVQPRGWRAGPVRRVFDAAIPPAILKLAVAVNHRPGRYSHV